MYWLKQTEIYSLTILEARSLQSTCWQDHLPSRNIHGIKDSVSQLYFFYDKNNVSVKIFIISMGFPVGSNGKESACNARDSLNSYVGKIPLEEGMATHSSILAWRIPWTEELGRLQSMGSQRVRHDWVTNTYTHIHIHIQRIWIMKNIWLQGFWKRGSSPVLYRK